MLPWCVHFCLNTVCIITQANKAPLNCMYNQGFLVLSHESFVVIFCGYLDIVSTSYEHQTLPRLDGSTGRQMVGHYGLLDGQSTEGIIHHVTSALHSSWPLFCSIYCLAFIWTVFTYFNSVDSGRFLFLSRLSCCIFSILFLCRVTGGELFEDIVAREFYSEADAR